MDKVDKDHHVYKKKINKKKKAPEQEMVQFIKPLSNIKVTKRGPWEGFKFYTPRHLSRGRLFFCHMTVCSVLMGFTKKKKKHWEGNSQNSFNHPSRIRKVK